MRTGLQDAQTNFLLQVWKCSFLRTDHPKPLRLKQEGKRESVFMCDEVSVCRYTHMLFLSGTGAAGSPACVGTSPWHLHWHRPESGAGRVGSPPPAAAVHRPHTDPRTGRTLPTPNWPLCSGPRCGPRTDPCAVGVPPPANSGSCALRWPAVAQRWAAGRSVGVRCQSGCAPPFWWWGRGVVRLCLPPLSHHLSEESGRRSGAQRTGGAGRRSPPDGQSLPVSTLRPPCWTPRVPVRREQVKWRQLTSKVCKIGIQRPARYFSGCRQVVGTSSVALAVPARRAGLTLTL